MEKEMDFWNWLWIVAFVLMWPTGYWIITRMGKTALSQYRTEKDEPADPKTLLAQARRLKEAELAQWTKDFQAILRRTCTHRFDGNSWEDWYICLDCGYEPEWKYSGKCSCRVVHDRSIAGQPSVALVERGRFCVVHGRELYVQRALKESKNPFSGGGYLGLHNEKYLK